MLGGPQAVNERRTLRHGLRYVEFAWDFGWWKVALAGRPGRLRVAFIETQRRGERTRDGLGVGMWESDLRRELRTLRCVRVRAPFRGESIYVTVENRCTYASHRRPRDGLRPRGAARPRVVVEASRALGRVRPCPRDAGRLLFPSPACL